MGHTQLRAEEDGVGTDSSSGGGECSTSSDTQHKWVQGSLFWLEGGAREGREVDVPRSGKSHWS